MQVIFKIKESHQDRWEIFVNGEKWREVHRVIFGRKPVLPSISLQKDLQSIFDAYEYRRVKSYVLWRMSHQSYHSEQLAKLLQERLVQIQTIQYILKECKDLILLDDEAWLKSFITTQQKRYSLRFILNKLYHKGFSSETLQRLAKEWQNPEEEVDTIMHVFNTRYRNKDLTQYKIRQKVIVALMRKGYGFDQIQIAFQRLKIENLENGF